VRKITVENLSGVPALLSKARNEQVLLTRAGKPVAVVTHVGNWDEEDWAYATDPEFWKMIRERRKEPTIPFERVRAEIRVREAAERRAKSGAKATGQASKLKRGS
jgi:hypothetical protein